MKNKSHFVLIALLGFLVYANSLGGKFLWDDDWLIKDNRAIKSWSSAGKLFGEDILAGMSERSNFYRPLQMLTYMADYSLWRLNPLGYHLTNILLHILVALALYRLVLVLFADASLSLATSLLFIVHPLHIEAVTYISGRSDPLAVFFLLLAFIFYIRQTGFTGRASTALMMFCYAAALLSRELSVILPFLLLLYHATFKVRIRRPAFFSVVGLALAYLALRATLLRSFLFSETTGSFIDRVPGFFVALVGYLRLLVLPFDLHMEYGQKLFPWTDPRVSLGILLVGISLFYLWKRRRRPSVITFGLAWFFLALLPVSNLYPIGAYMSEHWLYLPSMGLFLILAQGFVVLFYRRKMKALSLACLIGLLAYYSAVTVRQNSFWKDAKLFYERTLKYAPDSARVWSNLAIIYREDKDIARAIASYEKAVALKPDYADAYYNLGNAYQDLGEYAKAISAYEKATGLKPANADYRYNLGNAYRNTGMNEEAAASYRKTVELKGDFMDAYNNLGLVFIDMGQKSEAEAILKKAVEVDPKYPKAYTNLAILAYEEKRYDQALRYYDKAVQLGDQVSPEFARLMKGGSWNAR